MKTATQKYTGMAVRVNVDMTYNGIGLRAKCACLARGISGAELARRLGLHRTTVYRYWTGTISYPNPQRLFDLARELDVSEYWLMSGLGQPCKDEERAKFILAVLDEIAAKVEPVS